MKLKTILACLAAFLLSLSLQGKSVFRVFKVSGHVVKQGVSETEWTPVHKRDTLQGTDAIRIPAGGEIRIVALESGIIHVCTEEGTFSVKQIIAKSEAAQRGLLTAAMQELAGESRNKSGEQISLKAHGATVRGLDDSVEEQLAETIRNGEPGLAVSFVRKRGSYRMRVRNDAEACRICIVCLTPGSAALCLPAEGIVVDKGVTTLKSLAIDPVPNADYRAFRVQEEYDESLLLFILSE